MASPHLVDSVSDFDKNFIRYLKRNRINLAWSTVFFYKQTARPGGFFFNTAAGLQNAQANTQIDRNI
jgi:hypothetical protein